MSAPHHTPHLPPSVRIEPGGGGLPRVVVDAPGGTAQIYLQGAHVTSWRPAGHDDVLFVSDHSRYAAGTAIRGGVPLCFPWFGPLAAAPDAPAHGFARVSDWTLEGTDESGDDVAVTLGLTDSPATRASAWPHPFRATLRVVVGTRLQLALEVRSTGPHPVTFEAALHTYLAVGDVRRARITGLEENRYVDKLGGPEPVPASREPLVLTGATDRIYLDTAGTTTVEDPAGDRRVTVDSSGAGTTVVWNPWPERAAAMADLGDEEWTRMLCVETCNVGPSAVTLAPGDVHRMTATLGVAQPL